MGSRELLFDTAEVAGVADIAAGTVAVIIAAVEVDVSSVFGAAGIVRA